MTYAVKSNPPAGPVIQATGVYYDAAEEKRMKSRQLGTIEIPGDIQDEIRDAFDEKHHNGFYADYGSQSGVWTQINLANRDGNAEDGQSYEYDGRCQFTPHMSKLPKTRAWLKSHVELEHVKSVRIFITWGGGMIISHRDYLEFEKGFDRVHMPIVTNPLAVNSENDHVYHMRVGEVWSLVGEETHSALNDSPDPRLHLVLDFEKGCSVDDMFLQSLGKPNPVSFKLREDITDVLVKSLRRFTEICLPFDFKVARDELNRLHFYNKLHAGFTHDMILAAARDTGSKELIDLALKSRKNKVGA